MDVDVAENRTSDAVPGSANAVAFGHNEGANLIWCDWRALYRLLLEAKEEGGRALAWAPHSLAQVKLCCRLLLTMDGSLVLSRDSSLIPWCCAEGDSGDDGEGSVAGSC